jgi:hypothetical protein
MMEDLMVPGSEVPAVPRASNGIEAPVLSFVVVAVDAMAPTSSPPFFFIKHELGGGRNGQKSHFSGAEESAKRDTNTPVYTNHLEVYHEMKYLTKKRSSKMITIPHTSFDSVKHAPFHKNLQKSAIFLDKEILKSFYD